MQPVVAGKARGHIESTVRKEKLDKKKDVAKPPFPKIRRASGRLAGKKVFVEIPKKKYHGQNQVIVV